MLFNLCVVLILIIATSEIVTPFGRLRSQPCNPSKKYTPKIPNYDTHNLRISERKCKEYLWKMDEREQIKKHSCNKRYFVIRGQRTKPSEYPHMGALGWMTFDKSWIFLCGSSLISEKFVLTAAHCTKTKSVAVNHAHPKIVRLGVTDIYDLSYETPVDVAIRSIRRHPQYDGPKKYYDIALLELKTVVEFTKFVHPACLFSKPVINPDKELTVTGWGVFDKGQKFSHKLLYAKLDLFHPKLCDDSVLKNRNWWGTFNQQLCAGKADGSVDTCFGDSGGPLQYKLYETKKEGTMHMVVGITAFGSSKCALKNIPAVYTNVTTFIDWIEKHVWPEEWDYKLFSRIVFRD
ncbi:serine protease snake-like [Nymphalis io]|uniref:serine protease snake-like n=1 Tax=Inachis io TaxID=171585 RepID=UPI0021675EAE|nr:serine protease snake-like [Nymphalis io]